MKLAHFLALLALAVVLAPPALAQSDKDRSKFEKKRLEAQLEAGGRHLDLGIWCRDRGLTTQAAAEFLLAVELSDGQHVGARNVVSLMRRYDDAFWKKRKKGTERNRKSYEAKAERAREKDAKELMDLAEWAWGRKLHEEALSIYTAQLANDGEALEFDSKGRLVLAIGKVPAEASQRFKDDAIEIDGKLYVRDEFLQALPELEAITEVTDARLRLRGTIERELAVELHGMALALLPHLEEAIQGYPPHRLDVFIFATRADYLACLEKAGLGHYSAAGGLADANTRTAILCAEGRGTDQIESLVLHELTHLFWQGVTPAAMPDWFDEGLAETFGGQGTFAWNGVELEVGGLMDEFRLTRLRSGQGLFPLRTLLDTEVLPLWGADHERALLFYEQAWAFLRWLREAAPVETQDLYEEWVARSAGSASGAGSDGQRRGGDPTAANELFKRMMGDLDAIERSFTEWLGTL